MVTGKMKSEIGLAIITNFGYQFVACWKAELDRMDPNNDIEMAISVDLFRRER
jgi:hypothetical protein